MKRKQRKEISDSDEDSEALDFDDFLGGDDSDSDEYPHVSLYVGRWANSDFFLLKANSLPEAKYILDEIADPGGATLYPYKGPLFLDFTAKKKPFQSTISYMTEQVEQIKKSRNNSLYKHYERLFDEETLFDSVIRVWKDSETFTDLKCHASFVTSFSPYLSGMLDDQNSSTIVFDLGKHSEYTEEVVGQVLHFMYKGKFKDKVELDSLMEIIKLSFILETEEIKNYACMELYNQTKADFAFSDVMYSPFSSAQDIEMSVATQESARNNVIPVIVKILHFADDYSLNLLTQSIFQKIEKITPEALSKAGLKRSLVSKFKNFNFYKDGIVWNGPLNHSESELEFSGSFGEIGGTMWQKIFKTVFPHSYTRSDWDEEAPEMSDEEKRQAIIKESIEHEKRNDNDPLLNNPEIQNIMRYMGLTDADVLRQYLNFGK